MFSGLSRDALIKDQNYWAITPIRQKISQAARYGFDAVYLLKFTKDIQSLQPRQFVEQILVDQLRASYVVVGDDWKFGKNRSGSTSDLQTIAADYGISTSVVEEVTVGDTRVSSSVVRNAIRQGRFDELRLLLGRPYTIAGRVAHGQKLGRTIGYPTANISVQERVIPPHGVYAGYAIVNNSRYKAAISLGTRPAVSDSTIPLLEAYLINYPSPEANTSNIPLYGQWMEIELVQFIRPQQKFTTLESLKEKIADDVAMIDRSIK